MSSVCHIRNTFIKSFFLANGLLSGGDSRTEERVVLQFYDAHFSASFLPE
jgi:hypothetical protein